MQLVNYFISSIMAHFNRDEDGQTLVEYGLIVALISVVAIAALTLVGTSVKDIFNYIGGILQANSGT